MQPRKREDTKNHTKKIIFFVFGFVLS